MNQTEDQKERARGAKDIEETVYSLGLDRAAEAWDSMLSGAYYSGYEPYKFGGNTRLNELEATARAKSCL